MSSVGYDTWTLSSGSGTQNIPSRYWDGNTVSNLLIDQSANNCGVKHALSGSKTIENVGIIGKADVGGNNYTFALTGGGDFVFNNVYLPGSASGTDYMGIYATTSYSGRTVIQNCFIEHYADNALYLDDAAKGGNGVMRIENCFARNNNIASYRVGTNGSVIRNCRSIVDGPVPAHANGGKNARAVFTVYENQSIDVTGCHFAHEGHNAIVANGASVNVSNTQYQGHISGDVNMMSGNGRSPQTTVQAGVPTSPRMAASGDASSGGVTMPGGGGGAGGGAGGDSVTSGPGITGYRWTQIGFDDIPDDLEQPPATVTVNALVNDATWNDLNSLRNRDDPMDIAIGEFTLNDVGITDLSRETVGENAVWSPSGDGADNELVHDATITVQEHRIQYVQAPPTVTEDEDSEEDESPDHASRFTDEDFGLVPTPETTTDVDLGDEGLQPGDAIDPYLNEHLTSGTRVEIPAGTYEHTGDWTGGTYQTASLVSGGSPGTEASDAGTPEDTTDDTEGVDPDPDAPVILEADGDTPPVDITVPGGGDTAFLLDNIRFTGTRSGSQPAVLRFDVANGAGAVANRVRLPDGSQAGQTAGIRLGSTRGTVFARNCYIDGFAGGGIIAGDDGGLIVQGGLYRNNNVAGIDLAGDSRMERVTVANDATAPAFNGNVNQRGVWIHRRWSEPSGGGIVNCHFYHAVPSGTMLDIPAGPTMTGSVVGTRFKNLSAQRPLRIQNQGVSTDDCHLVTEEDGNAQPDVWDNNAAGMACINDTNCKQVTYAPPATDGGTIQPRAADAGGLDGNTTPIDPTPYFYDLTERVATPDDPVTITLGDDESLQGTVIRSIDGGRVHIRAAGANWTIQNVAIVGELEQDDAPIQVSTPAGASGTVETVYLPDGAPGTTAPGILVRPEHAGDITIHNATVKRFPNGGIRADAPGQPTPVAGGGDVTVATSYLKNNGTANLTLGTDGSRATGCVVYGDGTGPTPPMGDYTGIVGWYAPVTVAQCHVFMGVTTTAALAGREGGSIAVTGGAFAGGADETVSVGDDVLNNPTSRPPAGAPRSVVDAAPDF